jgi:hypothetical protein
MHIMNDSVVRFVVSSLDFLKWLREINTSGDAIAFIANPNYIKVSGNAREYHASAVQGYGDFVFSKEQIEMLISILKVIPDEPITIKFDSKIWIEHIMI